MWKSVRLVMIMILIFNLAVPPLLCAEDSGTWRGKWWNYYERALERSEKGDLDGARTDLEQAIELRDKDQRRARTYGMHYTDYFPHRELGVVLFESGKPEKAVSELEQSLQAVFSSKAAAYLNKARQSILKKQTVRTQSPPTIDITSHTAQSFTRNQKITISGTVSSDGYINKLSINGRPVRIEVAQQKASFSQPVSLDDGENRLVVVAENLTGAKSEKTITVVLKREGPSLSLNEASIVEKDGRRFVQVRGEVSDAAGIREIVLAGEKQTAGAVQRHTINVSIPWNKNDETLTFAAEDLLGNSTTATISLQAAVEKIETEERLEQQRMEADRKARELAEVERRARVTAELEAQKREQEKARKAEEDRLAKEKAEQERLQAEQRAVRQAEAARLAQLKADQEKRAKEVAEFEARAQRKAAEEKAAQEVARKERLALERAEFERRAREAAEQQRLARIKEQEERAAAEKAEQQRLIRERDEQERLVRERLVWQQAEMERLAREKETRERAEREKQAFEVTDRKKREDEKKRKTDAAVKSSQKPEKKESSPKGPDREAPTIVLKDSEETQVVFGIDTYALQGHTQDNVQVKKVLVDGKDLKLPVGKKVYFNKTVKLKEGQNKIVVEAVDSSGNSSKREVSVVRSIPSVMQPTSRTSLLVLPPDPGGREAGVVTPVLGEYLSGAFTRQKRFKMIERKKITQILDEQKFSVAMSDPDQAIKIGNMAAADMVLAGTVREDSKSVEVFLRVINSETSEQVAQIDGYTEDKGRESVIDLVDSMVSKVAETFPVVEGIVVKRDSDEVLADAGTQMRVRQNMGVIFFRKGKEIRHPSTGKLLSVETIVLGDGKISEVQDGFSKIILGSKASADLNVSDMFVTK